MLSSLTTRFSLSFTDCWVKNRVCASFWDSNRHENILRGIANTTLPGATSIASIGYSDLVYEDAPTDYVTSSTREVLMQDLLQRVRDGQVWVPTAFIDCWHALTWPALDRSGTHPDNGVPRISRLSDRRRDTRCQWKSRTQGRLCSRRGRTGIRGPGYGRRGHPGRRGNGDRGWVEEREA